MVPKCLIASALLAGIVTCAAPAPPARAASVVTVNSTTDPAPGACATTGTGTCTLREAVIFANAHPGSTIMLAASPIILNRNGPGEGLAQTGDLDIRADMTIIGGGSSSSSPNVSYVNGAYLVPGDRVFDIYPAGADTLDVSISGMWITGGYAESDSFGGGALWVGGDVDLRIDDTQFYSNRTTRSTGGAIDVEGGARVTVSNSRFTQNKANPGSPGADAIGGAIYVGDGVLSVVDSTFEQNFATGASAGTVGSGIQGGDGTGGAIGVGGAATVSLVGTTLTANNARGGAGTDGTGNESRSGAGTGGAVGIGTTSASVTVLNSTIASNTARGGIRGSGPMTGGGAAQGGGLSGAGTVTVVNTTVVRNAAIGAATTELPLFEGRASGGGIKVDGVTTLRLLNSIVAENTAEPFTDPRPDMDGRFSGGHNLFGVRDGISGLGPTDQSGSLSFPLDPSLEPNLAMNGGPTATIALRRGSPAIGAGDAAGCTEAGNEDQRGITRPQPIGGSCDIGAFEYQYAPTTTTLVSTTNPSAPGQAITLTATVSAATGSPTGVITIRDGATSLGGGAVAGGVVTVTTTALAIGSHSLTATYEGDAEFGPSSAALTQEVGTGAGGPDGRGVALQFFPLPRPVRLLDTRPAHDAFVAPGAPLAPNQPIVLPGRFTADGVTVPADAQALVGNATVDNSDGVPAGFATLWPNGSPLPLASNLNFVPGTVRPNSFTVGLGSDGKFDLLSNNGGHFIVDITGYFAPPATGGLYFHPLAQPVRLLDTRVGGAAVVRPGVPLTAGKPITLPGHFASNAITVPSSARALAGNATVDNTSNAAPGFATLYPGGTSLPPTSNLNFALGTIAPNAFTVGLGADGTFDLYSNTGGDFIIDITGYYDDVAEGGLLFRALAQPVRELDTRLGASAVVHPNKPIDADGTINLPGAFSAAGVDVPSSAALVGNATVDNTINAPSGFATLYPAGGELPLASNLNYTPGLTAPNAFIVGLGAGGSYDLYSQSSTNFIIDISGYFSAS